MGHKTDDARYGKKKAKVKVAGPLGGLSDTEAAVTAAANEIKALAQRLNAELDVVLPKLHALLDALNQKKA